MILSLPHPSHFSFHVQNPEGSDSSCPDGCHGYRIAAPDPGGGFSSSLPRPQPFSSVRDTPLNTHRREERIIPAKSDFSVSSPLLWQMALTG